MALFKRMAEQTFTGTPAASRGFRGKGASGSSTLHSVWVTVPLHSYPERLALTEWFARAALACKAWQARDGNMFKERSQRGVVHSSDAVVDIPTVCRFVLPGTMAAALALLGGSFMV